MNENFVDGITTEDELTAVNTEPAITITTEDEPNELLTGVVVDCTRLNVRNAPNKGAKVVATIPAGTEVLIDGDQLDDEFYCVCTASGVEGFCMKQFIEIQE